MSVYIRMTARGKIAQTIVMQIIMPYVSLSMRLTMDITLSCLPSPIMLLTSVLHVDENAARTIQNRPDMLLAILDMAVVMPVLDANKELLGMQAEINV